MRFPRIASMLLALVAVTAPAEAQRQCKKGKPCGDSCIAQNRTCHKAPASEPTARTTPPATARPRPDTTRTQPKAATLRDTVSASTPAAPATSGPWVASRRGSTYYRTGCSGGNGLAAQNRIYFASEQAAQAAGYRRSRQAGC